MGTTTPTLEEVERRRSALVAAVALCINDEHLTDLGTLKRTWFYAETGRDEPVGSLPWEQLRVMVREHNAVEQEHEERKRIGMRAADYESIGTTWDGVRVLAPKTKSENFTTEEIRDAVRKALSAEASTPSLALAASAIEGGTEP